MIAIFVALFLWLKRYPFVTFCRRLPFAYLMLGASYILFRTLHLVIDVRDERLDAPSFWDYLIYILFSPRCYQGQSIATKIFGTIYLTTAMENSEDFIRSTMVLGFTKSPV